MASHQPSSDLPSSTERSLPDTVAVAQTGAYIPNRGAEVRTGNDSIGSRTSTTISTGYGGFSANRRILTNGISDGDTHSESSSHGINQAEPRVNGASHDEEPSDNDVTDPTERARVDEIRPRAVARVFPVPAHACIHHSHTHSHENESDRRVRIPDGRQSFTVVLKVHFKDAQISYSRTFASMSSMTLTPDYNIGLHGDDFEHLYKLIAIRFNHLVARVNPAVARRVTTLNRNPQFNRYTVEVDLSTGENPRRARATEIFQNYGRSVMAPEDAKFITDELEEIVSNAIRTIDDLAAFRETRRRSADYDQHSIIPDFEARRAFEQERKYRWRIAMLESSLSSLMRERDGPHVERDPLSRPLDASHPVVGGRPRPTPAGDATTS